MAKARQVSLTVRPIMEPISYTALLTEEQRSRSRIFSPRPRSHFTRLHGRKESAMCHVPPSPLSVPLFYTNNVKGLELLHQNIYSNTDRKPFDIKLLVFRGKSERNFLFYTRRKNYFHIRLTSILRARAVKPPSDLTDETFQPCRLILVTFPHTKAKKCVVLLLWRKQSSDLPRPGL